MTATLLIALALAGPPQPIPASQSFSLESLQKRMEGSNGASLPFLGAETMRATLLRVAAEASDPVTRPARDILYQVVSGAGVLDANGQRHSVAAGGLVFVRAGTPRRFVDVKTDLTVLVLRTEAVPSTGGMAAGPLPVKQTPFPESSPRGSARVFYWFGPGSSGQFAIDYGCPAWKPAYGRFMTTPSGRRWRFGQNFWTRLDTNIPLTIAGVKVPAGYFYLVLAHDQKKGLTLVALDPKPAAARLLDAYQAPQTTGGLEIPLTHTKPGGHAARLTIRLDVDRTKEDHADLVILFGPHRLTAPVTMHQRK